MKAKPYVVVVSPDPPSADFLLETLEKLEIPTFYPQRNIISGENRVERMNTELNQADAVLVVANSRGEFPRVEDLETISRGLLVAAFKVILVLPRSIDTARIPEWLRGFQPLIYDPEEPVRTTASLVKGLTMALGIEQQDEFVAKAKAPVQEIDQGESLEALVAEVEMFILRLKFLSGQYRLSVVPLQISLGVVAAGAALVIYGIIARASNPLSGYYQVFGITVLALGGLTSFHSLVRWMSARQNSLLSELLIEKGYSLISEAESFLKRRTASGKELANQSAMANPPQFQSPT